MGEFPESPYPVLLPRGSYTAKSPTLYKEVEYTEEESWNEVERIVDEAKGSRWTVGQSLWFQVPLFSNPKFFWRDEYDELIREYTVMESFNLPLASSLDEARASRISDFEVIKRELTAARNYLTEKEIGRTK